MKIDVKIRWNANIGGHNEGDVQAITVDCDYIEDHDDLVRAIVDEVGIFEENVHYMIENEEQFWKDMDCPASEITNPEHRGFDEIRAVLRKYFEKRSNGESSKEYDPNFSAQDAIDEIAEIVGNY